MQSAFWTGALGARAVCGECAAQMGPASGPQRGAQPLSRWRPFRRLRLYAGLRDLGGGCLHLVRPVTEPETSFFHNLAIMVRGVGGHGSEQRVVRQTLSGVHARGPKNAAACHLRVFFNFLCSMGTRQPILVFILGAGVRVGNIFGAVRVRVVSVVRHSLATVALWTLGVSRHAPRLGNSLDGNAQDPKRLRPPER